MEFVVLALNAAGRSLLWVVLLIFFLWFIFAVFNPALQMFLSEFVTDLCRLFFPHQMQADVYSEVYACLLIPDWFMRNHYREKCMTRIYNI
jgi:hypothetical protein